MSDPECIGVGYMVDDEEPEEDSTEWHGVGGRDTVRSPYSFPFQNKGAELLLPVEGSHTNQVAATGSLVALPSEDAG